MTFDGPARILVVGSGGREHALAWKLAAEPGVESVVVAPGRAGMARQPEVSVRPDVSADDHRAVIALASSDRIDLVVIGPEGPLAAGLADALAAAGIAVFGPSRAAAAIESSKAFCHDVADAAGVPMARSVVCPTRSDADLAIAAIAATGTGVVIKDDGLAAGKGVTVLDPGDDPAETLDDLYGPATPDRRVLVEQRLYGPEASVIAICDGQRAIALPAARDHKRLREGDEGPNTGGMGAYSPLDDLDDAAVERIIDQVHRPILAEMTRRGTPFRGFLYAGLMLTDDGAMLLECNARLGDPEAQVILPLVDGALAPILLAAAQGELPSHGPARITVVPGAAVGVVLAGRTYPERPSRGDPIEGIGEAERLGALVFHAGTMATDAGWTTDGGRILTVVGRGPDLAGARAVAHRAADAIRSPGLQRRHDIGRQTVASLVR